MKIVVIAAALIDQGAKYSVSTNMVTAEERRLFGKLYLTNLKNKGMAMGVMADKRWFVLLTSALAIFIIFRHLNRSRGMEKFGLALMAGGGISNVFDRFIRGEVTDYLFFKTGGKTPVFNLADLFAVTGMVIVLINRLVKLKDDIST